MPELAARCCSVIGKHARRISKPRTTLWCDGFSLLKAAWIRRASRKTTEGSSFVLGLSLDLVWAYISFYLLCTTDSDSTLTTAVELCLNLVQHWEDG